MNVRDAYYTTKKVLMQAKYFLFSHFYLNVRHIFVSERKQYNKHLS